MSSAINMFINSPGAMLSVNAFVIALFYIAMQYEKQNSIKTYSDVLQYMLLYLIPFTVLSLIYYSMSEYETSRKIILYSSLPLYLVIGFIIITGRGGNFMVFRR